MHEVEHNLGLGYSNEGAEEDGDESCIMGSGFLDDGALLCYNGANLTIRIITFTILQMVSRTVGSSVKSTMLTIMT